MKTVILCCASLEKEVRLAMARKEISYPLHILTDNNHDVPNRLREAIQRELDGIQDADRVLMAFGTCGGAMVGLRTGNFQLILPRVDDCLSLLVGSMEQRYAALQGGFGIFLTESWLSSSRSMENELERIRRVYPPKRAETIIRLMYRNFDSLNVIDTGAYPVESILPRTQALAEQLHLTHRVVPVSGDPAGRPLGRGAVHLHPRKHGHHRRGRAFAPGCGKIKNSSAAKSSGRCIF